MHATHAWKKDKELYSRTEPILVCIGRQEQSRCRRRNPVRYNTLPPRRSFRRRAETNLLGSMAARGGFRRDRREKLKDLFVLLTEGWEFETGYGGFEARGGGRLGDLLRGGGKTWDTFSSEKTGFRLSTEGWFNLKQIWSLKYLSFLTTTLYGPRYSWKRGWEEASSRTNTNSKFYKASGRGLLGTGQVWWGTGPENLETGQSIFRRKPIRGNSGASTGIHLEQLTDYCRGRLQVDN